jgi:hypothetical protein
MRQRSHSREAGRRDADDERQFRRARHALGDEADRFVVIELRRFAHDAENGAAVGASGDVVVDHAVDAGCVDAAVGEKGVGAMGKTPLASTDSMETALARKGTRDDEGLAALLATAL